MKNKKVFGLIALLSFGLASCQAPTYPFVGPIVEQHKVTFLDANNQVILEDYVYNHENYTFTGEIPTKEQNDVFTYTFTGWDKDLKNITQDTTFRPVFSEERRTYTVTYLDGNEKPIWTNNVEAEDASVYRGPTPTKEPDALHSYEFNGEWVIVKTDNEKSTLENVLGDLTVQAQFNETARKHLVSFYSEDGNTCYYSYEVVGGECAVYPPDRFIPSKPDELSEDGETKTVYTFSGWDRNLADTPILEPTTFKAKFTSQVVPSDRAVVREYILDHKNDTYTENGYEYIFISEGYYLGYSSSSKDFSLKVEKNATPFAESDENGISNIIVPKIKFTVSFDYQKVNTSNAYFKYTIDETRVIDTVFTLRSFGEQPILEINGGLDHNNAENDDLLKGHIEKSDYELRNTLIQLSFNLNNYFINNDLPFLY